MVPHAAAAAAGASAVAVVSLPHLLISVGVFVLCCAAAAFLIASIPTLWAMGRCARRAEQLMLVVEQELPETAASMRLSGLELSDCIAEMSALSSDLTSGVRAGARMISSTEGGLRQAGAALGQTVSGKVVPALAGTEGQARGALEASLRERASLSYTAALLPEALRQTTTAVRRARGGLLGARLAGLAVGAGRALRRAVDSAAVENAAAEQRLARSRGSA